MTTVIKSVREYAAKQKWEIGAIIFALIGTIGAGVADNRYSQISAFSETAQKKFRIAWILGLVAIILAIVGAIVHARLGEGKATTTATTTGTGLGGRIRNIASVAKFAGKSSLLMIMNLIAFILIVAALAMSALGFIDVNNTAGKAEQIGWGGAIAALVGFGGATLIMFISLAMSIYDIVIGARNKRAEIMGTTYTPGTFIA